MHHINSVYSYSSICLFACICLSVVQHYACDGLLVSSGLPYAIVKPCPTFDLFARFQGLVIQSDHAFYGLGQGSVAFVDGRDVSDCVCCIILNTERFSKKEFIISGKQAMTGKEVATAMTRVFGIDIEYRAVATTQLKQVMEKIHVPQPLQEEMLEIQKQVHSTAATASEPWNTVNYTVKDITGHPPRTVTTQHTTYRTQ